jgi:hypothetical protein
VTQFVLAVLNPGTLFGALYGWLLVTAVALILLKRVSPRFAHLALAGYALAFVLTFVFWIYPYRVLEQLYYLVLNASVIPPFYAASVVGRLVGACAGAWIAYSVYKRQYAAALAEQRMAHELRPSAR